MNNYKFILTENEKQIVNEARKEFANKIENLIVFIDRAIKDSAKKNNLNINPTVLFYMIHTVIFEEVKRKIFIGERN